MSWERWMTQPSVRGMLKKLEELMHARESWEPVEVFETQTMDNHPQTLHGLIMVLPETPPVFSFSVSSGGVISAFSGSALALRERLTSTSTSVVAPGTATLSTGAIDRTIVLPHRLLRSLTELMKSLPERENPLEISGLPASDPLPVVD